MAEIKNNFIRSKMNKDLDARLIPNGEYRNAINAQISRSEGEGVGTLENILGNEIVLSAIEPTIANLISIGNYVDEVNNFIYIFLTDNYTSSYVAYDPSSPTKAGTNHFIYRYNASNNSFEKLVEGAFLNFSTLNSIYGINLLENLLFFTDNRNQPRKINVTNAANDSTYYTTEDQISVAKYNPYESIYLYEPSTESSTAGAYQTTMKDVVSKFMPTGGSAVVQTTNTGNTFVLKPGGVFNFYPNKPAAGQTVGKITTSGGAITTLAVTVVSSSSALSVTFNNSITLNQDDELVFFPNPYYDPNFAGDSAFLEDKFARFSYRFKFEDNEYSLVAPFTQPCFIPKQDGYFLTQGPTDIDNDQNQAVSSSIVSFMENKVNLIGIKVPLPTAQTSLFSNFKISEIEILYKESDGLSIKVVETIPVSSLSSSNNYLDYLYTGRKPFKTLVESEITRVYDKVPVKSLAQEVSGNRVIYSNFQNRHTPPGFLDYNVAATAKSEFDLRNGSATVNGNVSSSTTINISSPTGTIEVGSEVYFTGSPVGLLVEQTTGSPTITSIEVSQSVSVNNGVTITFQPSSNDRNTTSRIEYPSSSLKTNRSYQVGVVLSDKFGRTSDVILSNNNDVITIGGVSYSGPSLYSPYISESIADTWLGNSLKVLFNSVIGPANANPSTLEPGLYNGDIQSSNYNPLGWYSYKIVVQQKEQEYYNVYAPGALKGDLEGQNQFTLNQNISRIVLINDNINKIPRDLSEVGPQDKTFRSSVELIGRVENNSNQWISSPASSKSNIGNQQYYPDIKTFTTNTIQPLFDAFDWPSSFNTAILNDQIPIYAYYNAEANPFIAEITTSQVQSDQFGITNLSTAGTPPPPLAPPYIISNSLCVLETKPVTSLLDIYYETSTSGLVNDLNTAILNDLGISNSLFNFNFNSFDEGIAPNDNINTGNFQLVDNFGQALTPVTDYTSFSLVSVSDQQDPSQDVLSYFALVGNNTVNSYSVKVTSAFVNNIYYGNNAGERKFDLTFEAVLPGLTQPISFQEEIILGNLAPEIYRNTTTPPSPSDIVPSTETITPSTSDISIKTIYGRNGAFSGNGTYSSNPNTRKDLTWTIESVTTSQGGTVTNPPFALEVNDPASSSNFVQQCIIKNTSTPPESLRSDTYNINIKLSDAGQAFRTYVLTAVYGIAPSSVVERDYTIGTITRRFVEVEFNNIGSDSGFYLYTADWSTLTSNVLGNTIIISNPIITSDTCPFTPGNNWYYGSNPNNMSSSQTTARNKVAECYNTTPPPSFGGSINIPNAGSYNFEIQ